MKASRLGLVGFKFAVTAMLLWLLFGKTDMGSVLSHLHAVDPAWAAAVIGVLMAQLLLTGLRWHLIGHLVAAPMSVGQALRLMMIGQFFNQLLPTSLGGDAVRAWLTSREGIPFRRGLVGIVCDRAAALLVLTIIVAATLPLVSVVGGADIPLTGVLLGILPAVAVGGLLVLFLRGREIAETMAQFRVSQPVGVLVRDLRTVLFTPPHSVAILALAAVVQVMLVIVVYLCTRSIGVHLGLGYSVLLVPTILLVSAMPISFAGWGVREGAMVVGLGFAGIPAADALATSIVYGLAQIAAGLPGGAIWLILRSEVGNRGRAEDAAASIAGARHEPAVEASEERA